MTQEFRQRQVQCITPSGLHQLAYTEWGGLRNRKVLVCVHGLTHCGRDFDTLARAMASDYRVVCPDMPGRGFGRLDRHGQRCELPAQETKLAIHHFS